jgi:predicted amidophosphoribosyltransferase
VPTVKEYTDPYLPHYRRVPTAGPGVCDVCHGAPGPGFLRCWSCSQTTGQVTHEIELVVPISLVKKTDSQFYTTLMGYKGKYATASQGHQRLQMAALYTRFLTEHRECLVEAAGTDWNTITIVPSSGERPGPHPLETVLRSTASLAPEYRALLRKGPTAVTHNHADDNGYETTEDVSGRRVLLVDDTFTSGGRVQSAASRLRLDGATVVGVVVAGRIINPDFNDVSRELWDTAGAEAFSFDVCCLE